MNKTKKIFISYSSNDLEFADEIDKEFFVFGYKLIRDIRDVEYRESFAMFMQGIRKTDFVLMMLSDSFLKSINCMKEILELKKEINYHEKLFPIVLGKLQISDPLNRIKYTAYWQDKAEELEFEIKKLSEENKLKFISDLQTLKQIASNMSDFLQEIYDHKYISFEELKEKDFFPILKEIDPTYSADLKKLIEIRNIRDKTKREQEYEKFYAKGSSWTNALFIQGNLEYEKKNYNAALRYMNLAIKTDKYFIPAYMNRGMFFESLGKINEALNDYTFIINFDNKIIDGYYNRANLLLSIGEFQTALVDYSIALNLNPFDHEIYNNRGITLMNMGLFEQAINDFTQAIRIFPQKAKAFSNRGIANRKLNNYDKALSDYNTALSLEPNYADAYYNRASTKLLIGDSHGACSDWLKAHELGHPKAMALYEINCK